MCEATQHSRRQKYARAFCNCKELTRLCSLVEDLRRYHRWCMALRTDAEVTHACMPGHQHGVHLLVFGTIRVESDGLIQENVIGHISTRHQPCVRCWTGTVITCAGQRPLGISLGGKKSWRMRTFIPCS